MSTIILKGYIVVPNEDLAEVLAELETHKALTREEAGCLVFEVTPRKDAPNQFEVYEEFIDQTAFETHQARVKTSRWGKVSANALRHYDILR